MDALTLSMNVLGSMLVHMLNVLNLLDVSIQKYQLMITINVQLIPVIQMLPTTKMLLTILQSNAMITMPVQLMFVCLAVDVNMYLM